MDIDFIAATEEGKNAFWRYGVGMMVVIIFWLILGVLPVLMTAAWVQFDGNPATGMDAATGAFTGIDPILGSYLVPNLTFLFFLFGIWLAVRGVHRRPLRSLVTPDPAIRWRRVAQGFTLWGLLAGLSAGLEALLSPDAFTWSGVAPGRYLLFLLLALIFTLIQTTTEELFFRGYLLQATGRLLPTRWAPALLNGALFALPHILNPEVSRDPVLMMLYYAVLGAFFAWLTLRDGASELVLGAHAANNLFVVLFINYEGSALTTPALVMTTRFDPAYNLLSFLVMAVLFAVLAFRGRRATP